MAKLDTIHRMALVFLLTPLYLIILSGCSLPIPELAPDKKSEEPVLGRGMSDNLLLIPPEDIQQGIFGLITIPTADKMNPRGEVEDQTQFKSSLTTFQGDRFFNQKETDDLGQYWLADVVGDLPYVLTAQASEGYSIKSYVHLPKGKLLYQHNVHFASHLLYHTLNESFRDNPELLGKLPMIEVNVLSDWVHGAVDATGLKYEISTFFDPVAAQKSSYDFFISLSEERNTGLELLLNRISFYSKVASWRSNNVVNSARINDMGVYLTQMGFAVEGFPDLLAYQHETIRAETLNRLVFHLLNTHPLTLYSLSSSLSEFGFEKMRETTDPFTGSLLPFQPTGDPATMSDLLESLGSLPELPSLIKATSPGSTQYGLLALLTMGIPQKQYQNGHQIGYLDSLDPVEMVTLCYIFLSSTHTDSRGAFRVGLPFDHKNNGRDLFDSFINFIYK